MSRILGLDFGSHTVGVAMTDALGVMAHEYCTITREREHKLRRTLAEIETICRENDISHIVLGMPLNMDGSSSNRSRETLVFRDMLQKRIPLPVTLQDERLTTYAARDILDTSGVRREEQKKVIDQVAAAIILQDYIGQHPAEHAELAQPV